MTKLRIIPRLLVFASLVVPGLISPSPSHAVAQCDPGTYPAFGVTRDLWGVLQPTDQGQVPDERDSTDYCGQTRPDFRYPLFSSLDIENGYLFTTYSSGFQVWDVRGANAANPKRLAAADGWSGGFPFWPGPSETREYVFDVEAPTGDDTIVATSGIAPVGLVIWDTTSKASPVALYQDTGPTMFQVWAGNLGGRNYAFGTEEGGLDNGLQVYDMTAARQYRGCVENSKTQKQCAGVYVGRVGANQPVSYVDGFKRSDGRTFVAFSSGTFVRGVDLWDVTDLGSPINVNTRGGRFLSDEFIFGVALWQQGSRSFLALQSTTGGRIYDVTSCLQGGCSSIAGNLVWSQAWQDGAARHFVTYSQSDGTPYLYFGNESFSHKGLHAEWLFDISALGSGGLPKELIPDKTLTVKDDLGNPVTIDYWSWYYGRNPTGFNQVMPRMGKFNGRFFYRAAWTLFDVHERVNVSPTITINGPPSGFQGDAISFTAQASNCTADPGGWLWSTSGGTGAGNTGSAQITWSTVGTKTVSATNTGCPGATVTPVTIDVQDPAPVVQTATASPASALQCQPITFTATATGKPQLAYGWQVLDSNGNPVNLTGSGATFVWNTQGVVPGQYKGRVTVDNAAGSGSKDTALVTLSALEALPTSFAPTNDPFSAATVQFHVVASGATEWNWSFGDDPTGGPAGDGFTGWTNDPVKGPNPSHTYAAIDSYTVQVKVRNCQDVVGVTSDPLIVNIVKVAPLVASFEAANGPGVTCTALGCDATVNKPIGFLDTSSSDADGWFYAWNNTNPSQCTAAFDSGNAQPVTSHTYTLTGKYYPCLKVTRGGETSPPFIHSEIRVGTGITTPPPPPPPPPSRASIFINGPSSGGVDQGLTFTASASGCTPSSLGWSWAANGGGQVAAGGGASATITWSTTGPKTVTVTNSGCGSTTGTRTLTIGSGGGGTPPPPPPPPSGNDLKATFTFSPSQPGVEQAVSFDASGSTGSPTSFLWDFGDGSSGVGEKVTHTYGNAGDYQVMLEVGKPGQGTGCSLGLCTADALQQVTVGGSRVGTGICPDDPMALCLLSGRFKVTVDWTNQHDLGETGIGRPLPSDSDQTGFFYFFTPDNIELIVKVIDGRPLNNAFWVFYGALSDINYRVHVKDLETGETKTYENQPGNICGIGDTQAFPQEGQTAGAATFMVSRSKAFSFDASSPSAKSGSSALSGVTDKAVTLGSCLPSPTTLCLLNGRFKVEVSWTNQHDNGNTGVGHAVPASDATGLFWFFDASNIELVVKMIDGRILTDKFWFFFGALTDLEYDITVTDTETGESKTYHNDPGEICGRGDVNAL